MAGAPIGTGHATADGRRLLVIHGDQFDSVVRYARALALLGEWVESCTALVEHHDGRLELIDWAARNRLSMRAPVPAPA